MKKVDLNTKKLKTLEINKKTIQYILFSYDFCITLKFHVNVAQKSIS